ncbi:hypothetical protein KRB99_000027 [Salmonella enterica]|nr:hypothetical protein [Salmonella enterica]
MPKPTAKEVKATAKFIDRLTAVWIHNNPGTLKHFGKEKIRDCLLNEQLRIAFKRLPG